MLFLKSKAEKTSNKNFVFQASFFLFTLLLWNMEDARMKWNGRFQEWNGRQFSILPYQFHTRFRAWYLQKNIYR